jgi:hypothetical protein
MKSLATLLSLLMFTVAAQAKEMSKCHHSCFEKKYQCNIKKSHTVNNCHGDLLDCKLSCENGGGRNHNLSASAFPFDISF